MLSLSSSPRLRWLISSEMRAAFLYLVPELSYLEWLFSDTIDANAHDLIWLEYQIWSIHIIVRC